MFVFFFNDTATTEIYTLSLHDALPIFTSAIHLGVGTLLKPDGLVFAIDDRTPLGGRRIAEYRPRHLSPARSEEHTSELQSRQYLVCRLLLEKKKNIQSPPTQQPTQLYL